MVQAFAPHAADQAFHIRILPQAPWRRDDLFHAHRRHGRAARLPVCAVPVADQEPRRRAPRECLSDLRCDPRHRRVRRDTEMHDLAALVVEHDEPEQEVERGRGDHEPSGTVGLLKQKHGGGAGSGTGCRRHRTNGTAPMSSIRSSPVKRQIPMWPRRRSPFSSQSMLPAAPS